MTVYCPALPYSSAGTEPAQIGWGANSTLKVTPLLNSDCYALRCSEACKCLAPGSAQLERPRRDCYHICSRGEHWRQRCRGRGRPPPELGCYESYCPPNQRR